MWKTGKTVENGVENEVESEGGGVEKAEGNEGKDIIEEEMTSMGAARRVEQTVKKESVE